MSRKLKTPDFSPSLSWSHYTELIKIDRPEARRFYEVETIENHWSVRELKRQVNSLLFDRLAKSKDKQRLLNLACKGQEINTPEEAIKDPLVLEFLDLKEKPSFVETDLE